MTESTTAAADRPVTPGPGSVALLVEDEPVFQSQISDALAQLGYGWTVMVCSEGGPALDVLRTRHGEIALVIIDLGLPDIDGTEVIREAIRLDPHIPVLVASIHSDERHVLEAIRAGARGYLLKDDAALAIADSIRRVLAGEYPISPSLARYLFKIATTEGVRTPDAPGVAIAPKELELLMLLSKGHSYKTAAKSMDVALSTVQTYIRRIYEKLGVHSRVEALEKARDSGLLE